MKSRDSAPAEASGSAGIKSAAAVTSAGGVLSEATGSPNTGVEGRFDPIEQVGAETLRYSRPDDVTAKFESKIQASIVYLHELSQPKEYYIVRGKPSITQLLSDPGPAGYMKNLPEYKALPGDPNPDLVWIHLPANNMSWVEKLVTTRYGELLKDSAVDDNSDKANKDAVGKGKDVVGKGKDVVGKGKDAVGKGKDAVGKGKNAVGKDAVGKDAVGQLFLLSPEVWTQRQHNGSFTQPSKQERFLQPLYSRISTLESSIPSARDIYTESDSKPNSVLFMPYIHWEYIDRYVLRNKCLDWMCRKEPQQISDHNNPKPKLKLKRAMADETATNSWTPEQANKELLDLSEKIDIDSKLLLAYVHEDSPLHVRRTLDQSFYYTLADEEIRTRDLDQVLYRYTNEYLHMTAPRILMVDQLWLWIIDGSEKSKQPRTVITAFPQSWGTVPPAIATSPNQPSSPPPAPPSHASHATTNLPVTEPRQLVDRALYDFTGEGDNEISFRKDDTLTLVKNGTNGWCMIDNGRGKGWAPSSYLNLKTPSPGAATEVRNEDLFTTDDRSQFYDRIFSALLQPDVEKSSADDVVNLIIDKCSGLFHPRHDEIDHMLDYLEVFAIVIGKAANRQTTLHNALCTHSERLQKLQGRLRQLSSASLRERWGRQLEPATQGANIPVEVVSLNPSLAEEWSKFPKLADPVVARGEEFPDIAEPLSKGTIPKIELLIEHEMNYLVDITKETELMKETKDILDELNMISSIFKQQLRIVKAMAENKADSKNLEQLPSEPLDPSGTAKGSQIPKEQDNLQDDAKNSAVKYTKLHQKLKGREQDIEDLKTEGTRVYKAICDLLDLKQKQASVSEAYSARQEAKESARQGNIILVFTIVTIIFLPLSFIAAIFSMNAKEINDFAGRTVRGVLVVMLPFTVGTLIFSLILAYYISIKWFLIGLFTWARHRHNQALKTAATPSAAESPAQKAPDQGTTSSSGTSAEAGGGAPTEARRRAGFSWPLKHKKKTDDQPPGQAGWETV
ncbi:SH3-domain-containing protein [Glarea lozoyensis ATCC 20868]|uniref:SH3-domain-containing protein n=1 Tax=Glarea lozoyensis (strain ATCC 20868 / MF5171) TaxID=1116229 RepID=S3DXY2_GLAL2|nr:SH3-domain-containing protein [Glarea lozoyensis ATCC 20868]EPE36766.1 SH3-domain-containing protein [Glarea lozoyensis ATCC 20868]